MSQYASYWMKSRWQEAEPIIVKDPDSYYYAKNLVGRWPEAEKAMFRNVVEAENKILHIKSCCDKALEDNIIPLKNYLWNKILCHSVSKEV